VTLQTLTRVGPTLKLLPHAPRTNEHLACKEELASPAPKVPERACPASIADEGADDGYKLSVYNRASVILTKFSSCSFFPTRSVRQSSRWSPRPQACSKCIYRNIPFRPSPYQCQGGEDGSIRFPRVCTIVPLPRWSASARVRRKDGQGRQACSNPR